MNIGTFEIQVFILVFMRISGLFTFAPFFSSSSTPQRAKLFLSFLITFIVFPIFSFSGSIPDNTFDFTLMMLRELFVGFIIGGLLHALFTGVQMAGNIIGFQMGFSLVTAYDPDAEGQIEIIAQLKFLFCLTLFLIFNGHHFLLEGIVESYQIVPLGQMNLTPQLVSLFVDRVGQIFSIAVKLGAPSIVALWVTNVCLAILNRLVPQMNIFMVDFPVKISVGFISLVLAVPYFTEAFKALLGQFFIDMNTVLKMMVG